MTIFIRQNIAAREVKFQTLLEVAGAEIDVANTLLISVTDYNPPIKELLAEDIQNLLPASNTIVAGDLNVKFRGWWCRSNNKVASWLHL